MSTYQRAGVSPVHETKPASAVIWLLKSQILPWLDKSCYMAHEDKEADSRTEAQILERDQRTGRINILAGDSHLAFAAPVSGTVFLPGEV